MPATFSKPTEIPRWADTGVVVVPAEAKKDTGWLTLEKPPASFFNWLGNRTGNWFKWINERFEDGTGPNANVLVIKNPNDGTQQVRTLTAGGIEIVSGLNVGFAGISVADTVKVGDANFMLDFNGGTPRLTFDTVGTFDGIEFSRGGNAMSFFINNAAEMTLSITGLIIPDGLNVGFSGTPVADRVLVGDVNFGFFFSVANPEIVFDQAGGLFDTFVYFRAADRYAWYTAGVPRASLTAVGLSIGPILTNPMPFYIEAEASAALGGTPGNFLALMQADYFSTNRTFLFTYAMRHTQVTAPSFSWQDASTYIHDGVDSTYMGFIRFGKDVIFPGVSRHVGIGVGGFGAQPTLIVDSSRTYFNDKDCFLEVQGAGVNPVLAFDGVRGDYFVFTRSATVTSRRLQFFINSTKRLDLDNDALALFPAIGNCNVEVGYESGVSPTSRMVGVGDANFAMMHVSPSGTSAPFIRFNENAGVTQLSCTRGGGSTDLFSFIDRGVTVLELNNNQFNMRSLSGGSMAFQIERRNDGADPGNTANFVKLYCKLVGGVAHLFAQTSTGVGKQLT